MATTCHVRRPSITRVVSFYCDPYITATRPIYYANIGQRASAVGYRRSALDASLTGSAFTVVGHHSHAEWMKMSKLLDGGRWTMPISVEFSWPQTVEWRSKSDSSDRGVIDRRSCWEAIGIWIGFGSGEQVNRKSSSFVRTIVPIVQSSTQVKRLVESE